MARDPIGYNTLLGEARVGGEAVARKNNRNLICVFCSLWRQLDNTDLKRNLRGKKKNRQKNPFNWFQFSQCNPLPIYQDSALFFCFFLSTPLRTLTNDLRWFFFPT